MIESGALAGDRLLTEATMTCSEAPRRDGAAALAGCSSWYVMNPMITAAKTPIAVYRCDLVCK